MHCGQKLTFNPPPIDSQEAPANQGTSERQECLVNVSPLFAAHAQPPELIQPSKGPFDHPAPSAQSAAMFRVALRQKRDDSSVTQTLINRKIKIAILDVNNLGA
jgi:hypothetical protein